MPKGVACKRWKHDFVLNAGELEAAVGDYSIVLEIEADHVEAIFHRGTVYEKLGKLDEAIEDFSKVLALEPDHVKASYARGTCRNLKGDFAPAIGKAEFMQRVRPPALRRLRGRSQELTAANTSVAALQWGFLVFPNFSAACNMLLEAHVVCCRGLCQSFGKGQEGPEASTQESHTPAN